MTEIDLFKKFGISNPPQFSTDLRIHVAEAHNELRLIIAHHLAKTGFGAVASSRDGQMTLAELSDKPVDIVLVDQDLPSVNGLDLLKELREDPALVRGAFVLISKPSRKEEIMLALEAGIDDFLIRPFTPADILPRIRNAYQVFINPKNPERIYEHAKSLLRAKDFAAAKQIYQTLSETSKAARPLVGLARIAEGEGNLEEALKLVTEAITRNENFVHAFSFRGELYLKLKEEDKAVADFEKAVALSPLNIARYERACAILLDKNQIAACVRILSQGVAAGLDHPFITERLGYCHFLEKDYTQAIKFLSEAVRRDPNSTSYTNSLAICYRDAGEFDKAITAYNTILKREPENYQVLFNKSLIFIAKKDNKEAIKILYRILKLAPDYDKARLKIKELGADPDAQTVT